ncbi:MAG TPA: hypothetical protein VMZ27_14605 [Candidatus Saccharimonadales bacterium]|nr:hypothetical protein [Candidatus Saccharimonadales bacterium]
MTYLSSVSPQILIVDHNQEDVFMLMWALETVGVKHGVQSMDNPIDAISYIKERLPDSTSSLPLPALILLAADLPKMSGYQVLDWIASQPTLNRIHIRMLSSSSDRADPSGPEGRGYVRFWIKPTLWQEHMDLAREMKALLISTPNAGRPSG